MGMAVTLASAPLPEMLTARTLNVYCTSPVRPVNVWFVRVSDSIQVEPLSIDTSKRVIGTPPVFEGAAHMSAMLSTPGVAARFLGAVGSAAALADILSAVPLPLALTARTLKLYDLPLTRLLNVWLLLPADFLTQVLPPSMDTS